MALSTGTTAAALEPGTPVTIPLGERGRRLPHLSAKIWIGLALLGVFVVMAIIGPMVAPYDPTAIGPHALAAPSAAHLLGTTTTGQDVLSELLVGARATLTIALLAGTIATALSVIVGVTAGYLGGAGGEALNMLSNVFLVIPLFPLLVVLTAFLPNAGSVVIGLVIAMVGWAWGARVLRAQTLALRNQDFVQAARAVGERGWRIVLFEILPNEVAVVASSFLFTLIAAIGLYASLIFLGLGSTTDWSWGLILYWATSNEALAAGAWWWFVPAGLCLALLGMSLALINFGLDEFINPRLRAAGLSRKGRRELSMNQALTPVERQPQRSEVVDARRTGR